MSDSKRILITEIKTLSWSFTSLSLKTITDPIASASTIIGSIKL